MSKRTALYQQHLDAGAKMVDFAGWDMPLHYGSQIKEHHQVREHAGMFDVSHMTVVDFQGLQVQAFLRHLLANDVARLKQPGKALYSCMLDAQGGVVDDLIVYLIDDEHYRMVVNAGTRDKDLAWMFEQAKGWDVSITERPQLAMLAVQGPEARAAVLPLLDAGLAGRAEALGPFYAAWQGDWFVARTGYTGEDGFELILPEAEVAALWQGLLDVGVAPIGLGARDSLRLEAGMNLYGTDMDETTSPLESALAWTIAWEPAERDFIGRSAIAAQREQGVERKLVGLVLEGRGVIRGHQPVRCGEHAGEVTSGGFSPTLNRSIAFARVASGCADRCEVEMRGKWVAARVVRPPFVRNGKARIEL